MKKRLSRLFRSTTVLVLAMAAVPALVVALGATGCQRGDGEIPPSAAEHDESTAEAVFSVQGMHCASCPITVRTAAKRIDGVSDARVSVERGQAWVTYDRRKTSPGAIALAITDSGYPTSVMDGPSTQPSHAQQ